MQQNFHAVSGKAMMVRRTSFLQAGGFSEEVEDRYKDVDLCLKLEQLGLNNVYDPGVILLCQGRTLQKKKAQRTATVFRKKWKALLEQPDGYYNTNLSLESSDYRIREYP